MNWTHDQLYNARCIDPKTSTVHRGVYYASQEGEGWFPWCSASARRLGPFSNFQMPKEDIYSADHVDTVSMVTCLECLSR